MDKTTKTHQIGKLCAFAIQMGASPSQCSHILDKFMLEEIGFHEAKEDIRLMCNKPLFNDKLNED